MTVDQVVRLDRAMPAWARPTEQRLREMVCYDLGRPGAELVDWWVEPVGYRIVAPGTAGLYRVRGRATDGGETLEWSLFVKLLRSFRHAPGFELLPAELRAWPWDYEIDVYWSGLGQALPAGLRLPVLHSVYDSGDQQSAMWLQDVAVAPVRWDRRRYERAATLLGRLAARLTLGDLLPPTASRRPGEMLWQAYRGPVRSMAIPALDDDGLWRHPLIAGRDPALRSDLLTLAGRMPAVLDSLDRLPHAMMHGDACPQNLLVPADDPDSLVAVDWSYGGLVPVGYDLGQLLVGHAHSGALDVAELPALADVIVDAYTAGMAWEGMAVEAADVRRGFQAAMVLRSAFMSLPVERLDEPVTDYLDALAGARIRLTRYLVDVGLALP